MNKKQFQNIFKRSAVDRMRNDLRAGESLNVYFSDSYAVKENDIIASSIVVQGKAPALKIPKSDPASADLENAIELYNYFGGLDETQASDSRLWAYLSHVEFRKYTIARWGLSENFKNTDDKTLKQKAIIQILDHWFVNGNDRDLRRHTIARLWWAAHLTHAPWDKDPEYFSGIKKEDPYYYTRVLLSTQDIYQQVLERAMGRSSHILIAVLDYLSEDKELAESREKIRSLMKELNLLYGTKKIIVLDFFSLKKLISVIAADINN